MVSTNCGLFSWYFLMGRISVSFAPSSFGIHFVAHAAAVCRLGARCTNRTGKILPRPQVSNIARSWADKTIGFALLLMIESISILVAYVKIFMTHYTRG